MKKKLLEPIQILDVDTHGVDAYFLDDNEKGEFHFSFRADPLDEFGYDFLKFILEESFDAILERYKQMENAERILH